MGQDGETLRNKQKAVAEGKGSLAINAASYANVTVYQYVTYEGGRATKRETTDPSECPYPGLETFHTSEAKYFAGREEEVALLETTLENNDICGVIAASGAGKSSLVHAGLIPALVMREHEAWDVFAFKPGQEPLYGLARSMSGVLVQGDNLDTQLNEIRRNVDNLRETSGRLSEYVEEIIRRRVGNTSGKRHRVLIFIDQWEELYTRENLEDRVILVRELMDVVERGLAKVLLTMRIDFMEEMLLLSTDFFRSLKPGIHYVEPMDEIGLRSAIENPARKVGLCIPGALTSRLIADLGKGRDYGSLPYLQFVLRQLWEKRDQATNSLTTESYDGMKGLKGAIGAHADAVLRKLTNEEKRLAQRILPHLANVSEAGIVTSRRMPFADFDEPARKLLRKLAEPERRLIVLSSATEEVAEAEIVAEVAHEALLDDWEMLSGWIADRKDFFRLRNKLEADAESWIKNKRRHDFLIPAGKPLLDAQDLLAKALDGDISKDLRDFVEICIWRARSRRWRTRIAAACVVILAIGVATYFADLNEDLAISNTQLAEQTQAEALARFKSEVRLAGSIAPEGTSEAWEVLTLAARDYAKTVGEAAAIDAMDADVLTVALQALINQRVFQPQELENKSSEIIGFSPDGSILVVSQNRDFFLVDAGTTELQSRLANLGAPILSWPIGDQRFGLIVCADAPCILQEALSANQDNGEGFKASYIEYMASDDRLFENEGKFWELVENYKSHIREDIKRRKINFVILDTKDKVAISYALLECDNQYCIGNMEGRTVSLDWAKGTIDHLSTKLANSKFALPLRVEDGKAWIAGGRGDPAQLTELPPAFELDPTSERTRHAYGSQNTVIRTSFTDALIEIFTLDAGKNWMRTPICLEFDEQEKQCAGGLIGTKILDISADGKLVLATSSNQGTGGGNGKHQTVLINVEAGAIVWRTSLVISHGAFAPDGSTFTTIDWLGYLEVRSESTFDIVYRHGEQVDVRSDSKVFSYHPHLPEAALREQDGNIVLLDLTPTPDIGSTTEPLRSMRGMCRKVDQGPFRTILSQNVRPLNTYDWGWATDEENLDKGRLLPIVEPFAKGYADLMPDGSLNFEESNQQIEFSEIKPLVEEVAPELTEHESLRFRLSSEGETILVWGNTPYLDDEQQVKAHWMIFSKQAEGWAIERSGTIEDALQQPERVSLASENGYLAATWSSCSIELRRLDTDERLWSDDLAFSLNADLEIVPSDGIVIAFSREWYDAHSLQVFDLKTGAPGPWVNVTDVMWPYDQAPSTNSEEQSDPEKVLVVRVPPWGDRLRKLIIDAARGMD